MDMYFHEDTALWFEGHNIAHGIWPAPLVLPAVTFPIGSDAAPQDSHLPGPNDQPQMVFREDSFDPLTRIRRGRFYFAQQRSGHAWVLPHPGGTDLQPFSTHPTSERGASLLEQGLRTYSQNSFPAGAHRPQRNDHALIGWADDCTQWRVLAMERGLKAGTSHVILQAISNLGSLPELEADLVPELGRQRVRQAITVLVDGINRAGAESIVDLCRTAAAELLAADQSIKNPKALKLDLGPLIKRLASDPNDEREMLVNAADIVRRLHARNKPNEAHRLKTRMISDHDAQTAIHCVGLIMQELRWVR